MHIRPYRSLLSWFLAIGVTLFLFVLSATWGHFEWQTHRENSNYWALSDAFLQGQLHLPIEPQPELLSLPNPYIRSQRSGIPYIWDASLYKGRYYLYFGPVPALVAFIPFKLLFGDYPSDNGVIFTFSLLATTLLYVACRLVSGRLTQAPPPGPAPMWFLYFAFASSLPLQLGGGMYVVGATCAMCFQVVALISLLMLITSSSGRIGWSILAGVATVGAIGSRPTYVMALPLMALALARFNARTSPRGVAIREALAFATPVVVGGLLLATYNYLRFDDPTEFGITYQLGLADLRTRSLCSITQALEQPRVMLVQAWYVFFQPPTFIPEYPYLVFSRIPASKVDDTVYGYFGPDDVTGLFVFSPLLIPALAATLLYWHRFGRETRIFLSTSLMTGAVSLVHLHNCFGMGARYLFEAYIALTTVCIPMLWVACSEARGRATRGIWRLLTFTGLFAGIVIGALGALDGHFGKGASTAQVFQRIEMKARTIFGLPGDPYIQWTGAADKLRQ